MTTFKANFFDGKTAHAYPVNVTVSGQTLEIIGSDISLQKALTDIRIEPILGKTTRVIKLRSGEKLESIDFTAVAALEQSLGANKGMRFVHKLEQSWRLVLVCFVGLILATVGFIRFGVPWIAAQAAAVTPISVLKTITDSAFKSIDGNLLQKTKLSATRAAQLQSIFARVKNRIGKDYPYELMLRSGAEIGANAFALPSGTVVMTDELVKLAKSDLEIEAVLAHEVGHVIHRHGLRNLYQSVGIVLLAGIFVGDFSSVAGLGTSLPALLLQSGYSQEFEFQSDQVAGKYLLETVGSTKAMRDMLENLEGSREKSKPSQTEKTIQDIFRTHPITPERIRVLEEMERK